MANAFKNAKQICTISLTDVYTVPANTTAIVAMLQAANVTNRADVITVVWTDASNGNAVTRLGYQVPTPANQAIGLLTGKLFLEAGDKVRAQSGIHQAIEITMAILEIS
jgi:hypothetical protein